MGETLELDDLPIPHPWPTSVPTHTDHLGFDVEPEILIPPFQLGLEPNQDPVLTQTAPRGVQSSQKNRRELSKKAKGKQPAKRSIVNVDPEPDEDDARAAESRRRGKMRARVPPSVLNELESARGSRVEDDHRRRAHGESTFDSRLPRAAAYTQLVVPDASIYPIVPAVSPQHVRICFCLVSSSVSHIVSRLLKCRSRRGATPSRCRKKCVAVFRIVACLKWKDPDLRMVGTMRKQSIRDSRSQLPMVCPM